MSGLTRWVPPILSNATRRWRMRQHLWDGVYAHVNDVPTVRAEYGGELTAEMVTTTSAALTNVRTGQKPYLWHEPFALVAGAMASPSQPLRVVDFGGGTGSAYVQLLASLPRTTRLDYLVVDSAEMGEAGRQIFAGDSQIRFAESLPAAGHVDLIYANAVLPYIEHYRDVLMELAGLGAAQIFLGRLAAGSNPTFASRQLNLPGRAFAYWFLNIDEVGEILAQSGYRLIYDGFVDNTYDQGNLPATHRVERFRNVLFARRDRP